MEASLVKNIICLSAEAEAKALEEEVSFSWDACILDAVFECDLKIVAAEVLSFHTPTVAIDNVIVGIWQRLQDFRSTQVSHVQQLNIYLGTIHQGYR